MVQNKVKVNQAKLLKKLKAKDNLTVKYNDLNFKVNCRILLTRVV